MRVAIVHGSNDTYGASRVLIHEVKSLISLGHSVHVLVPAAGPLNDEVARLGAEVQISVEPGLLVLRRSNLKDVLRFPKLPESMRAADVVVLWTLAVAGYVPLLRLARKKFYVAVHELLEDRRARLTFRLLLRGSFPLTACSKATAAWLRSLGVKGPRISVTYPVIDVPSGRTVREARVAVAEKTTRPFTVAVFGRVNGHKGHLEVATAFRDSSMSDPNWRLVLAGAPFPGQESALEDVLAVAVTDSRITYVGELSSLGELDGAVDLVAVFPTKSEPFGLVPIEAWSFGIPSIGYGDGGAAEVLPMVGGTAIERTGLSHVQIASALVAERDGWDRRSDLPSAGEVAPKLSFENRTNRIYGVLVELVGTHLARAGGVVQRAPHVRSDGIS